VALYRNAASRLRRRRKAAFDQQHGHDDGAQLSRPSLFVLKSCAYAHSEVLSTAAGCRQQQQAAAARPAAATAAAAAAAATGYIAYLPWEQAGLPGAVLECGAAGSCRVRGMAPSAAHHVTPSSST